MEKFTLYMSIIKKHINGFMTEAFKPYNITGAEAPFIREIAVRKNCRQADLSKILACDKAHTHRIVTKLIDKQLIQFASPKGQYLELTEKGKAMVESIDKTIKAGGSMITAGLTQEEIDMVLNILKKCAENASKLKMEVNND
ncbi:MAG: winged helix-turn-helix transcriptional regulator [Clostridia bacterium]|nr:winged helix-turn-helix transcriptional regulator [Clostridia bacterium]